MEKPLPGRAVYSDKITEISDEKPIPTDDDKKGAVILDFAMDSNANADAKMRKFEEFKAR